MKIPVLYQLEWAMHRLRRAATVRIRWLYHKKQMKHYDQILMLGRNCEPAFYFLRQFGFLDSNLFAWAAIREKNMLAVLNTPELLLTGEVRPVVGRGGMLQHVPTGFFFHSRSSNYDTATSNDVIQRDIAELRSRLKHLTKKFEHSLHADQDKLFILTVADNVQAEEYLAALFKTLQSRTHRFALLCIMEQKNCTPGLLAMQTDTLFVRFVDRFAPSDNVTNLKAGDPKGWRKIFSEFGPDALKKSTKRFKFDSRD